MGGLKISQKNNDFACEGRTSKSPRRSEIFIKLSRSQAPHHTQRIDNDRATRMLHNDLSPQSHVMLKGVLLFVGCKNKVRRGRGADVLRLSIQLSVYGVQAIIRAHRRPGVQILSSVKRALQIPAMLETSVSDRHASFVGQQWTVVGGIFAQIQPLDGLGSGLIALTALIEVLYPSHELLLSRFTSASTQVRTLPLYPEHA